MSTAEVQIPVYNYKTVTPKDFFKKHTDHPVGRFKSYLISLFPIAQWIWRYNFTWLYGDMIAGLTVGAVVVPQGMSYAKLAQLSPEYGLYASFVGVFIYCFFATSKDVSIGPVAVMSLQVGRTITRVIESHPQFVNDGPLIAVTIALLCGGISLGIGLLRLGFILEFIPIPSVMGFMTGSAFSIIVGQVPGLFGVSKRLDTRAATYKVVIDFFKQIKHSNVDAAFGLVTLFILFGFKALSEYGMKKWPRRRSWFFYMGVLRNAVVIIFATLISFLCYRKTRENPAASLIKTVPSGLRHVGVPTINSEIVKALAPELPVSVIVLLLEHIAISKSFGRINNYKIVPDQELIAIGVTNIIGIFFAAYPATGSFSRSALKSKCGVRTPLAGIYTGAVVLLALYALTEAFYFIPNAALCAVIIHAVFDLISHPKQSYHLWVTSPVEGIIFFASVIITVFVTIEAGIYFSIASSVAFLLLRLAKAKPQFLGRIKYFPAHHPVVSQDGSSAVELSIPIKPITRWVPLDLATHNPHLKVHPPPRGTIVFKPTNTFTFPNCSSVVDDLLDEVKRQTRPLHPPSINQKKGDRAWNDHSPLPSKNKDAEGNIIQPVDLRPVLKRIVIDFSSTPEIDLTGVQNLTDIKNAINRYVYGNSNGLEVTGREIEWHFVGILSDWSKRALLSEGFGIDKLSPGQKESEIPYGGRDWVHDVGESQPLVDESYSSQTENDPAKFETVQKQIEITETRASSVNGQTQWVSVLGTNVPYFHLDIPEFEDSADQEEEIYGNEKKEKSGGIVENV